MKEVYLKIEQHFFHEMRYKIRSTLFIHASLDNIGWFPSGRAKIGNYKLGVIGA